MKEFAADALERVQDEARLIRAAEVRQSIALAELAESYSVNMDALVPELAEKTIHPGDDGTPGVSEFLSLELGPALGMSRRTALEMVADVLNLKHRHPGIWDAYCRGAIPRWQAARLVDLASSLSAEAAAWVDQQIAFKVGRVAFPRLKRIMRGLVAQADPELLRRREEQARDGREVFIGNHDAGSADMYARLASRDAKALDKTLNELACAMAEAGDERSRQQRRASALGLLADPAAALAWLEGSGPTTAGAPASGGRGRNRGRTVVYVHLSERTLAEPDSGVARIDGLGPLTTASLPEFLSGTNVTLRPVVDDATVAAVDSYEIPQRIRDAVHRRSPAEVFPFSSLYSKSLDLDHVAPFARGTGWQPGQTGIDNLAPLSRLVHRAKTLGAWRVEKTNYGHFCWTSPLGRKYTVGPAGMTRTSPVPRVRR
ncbi:13E12 repeat family protein [Tessaracoccus sp. OS52]|uniref:DUF222 domain-containing protein n=1 Tax=Tessaracoccus sp. OS52 TaxID=2886691 RepID=UPI001D11B860|nr:DUF222 domain-containing protein [Tessaracoccus sp. OS52]MCC2593540.1 13E12 repeat family protein [Tessaracoccus sp. OS52]